MSFHIVGPRKRFLREVFPTHRQKFVIRSYYIHVECIPKMRDQEMKLVRQDQRFSSISATQEPYSATFPTF